VEKETSIDPEWLCMQITALRADLLRHSSNRKSPNCLKVVVKALFVNLFEFFVAINSSNFL